MREFESGIAVVASAAQSALLGSFVAARQAEADHAAATAVGTAMGMRGEIARLREEVEVYRAAAAEAEADVARLSAQTIRQARELRDLRSRLAA